MKVFLRPPVEGDLAKAGTWYEERQPGLRERFVDQVGETLARIEHNPLLYQTVALDIRRAPLRQFPYGIYYILIEEEIHVLAVVHDARHPAVWRRRR